MERCSSIADISARSIGGPVVLNEGHYTQHARCLTTIERTCPPIPMSTVGGTLVRIPPRVNFLREDSSQPVMLGGKISMTTDTIRFNDVSVMID